MNIKQLILSIFTLSTFALSSYAQDTYKLMVAERGNSELTIGEVENNGTVMLAARANENSMPAIYTFKKELSDKLGKKVYFNSFGLYVIEYDDESYINVSPKQPLVMLGKGVWETFAFVNFYSKNESKVKEMTAEKVQEYAKQLSKEAIK